MHAVPRRRLTTTFWVVLSLLFSQLALASYVCTPAVTPGDLAAMEMGAGQPCEGMAMEATLDPVRPGLCLQHCVDAPLSFEPVQVPSASLPALVQVLFLPVLADAGDRVLARLAETSSSRPPPDPLFLSTLRLRV
jgi:hypothetical protein